MARGTRLAVWLGAGLLASHAASATSWYVDGLRGQQKNAGTSAAPFKYYWQGAQAAKPGDTIYLLPTVVYSNLYAQTSGTSAKPITISGAGVYPNLTKAVGDASHFGMWIDANYVVVQNLDLTAPGTQSALHIAENHHHVTIANNVLHDAGGNGISSVGDDYLTFSHNTVYGNARNTSGGTFGSGISLLSGIDIDTYTGVKNRIDGNIVYANTNVPACTLASCLAKATDSDGSGIIVDDMRRTQRDHVAYRGRTLISNNVIFGNGGRGVHIYQSDHVTVSSNTIYYNNQDPYEGSYRPGEVTALYSSDVSVYDNILVTDGGVGIGGGKYTGTHVSLSFLYCSGGGQLIGRYNLVFNPQNNRTLYYGKEDSVPVTVSDNIWGDPQFIRASLNPALADFRPRAGSPALGAGNLANSVASDLLGAPRVGAASIGAFQAPASVTLAIR